MGDKDEEEPPRSRFFTARRAKLCCKTTPDELKAASEFLEKIQEEKTKAQSDLEKKVPAAKKAKTRRGTRESSPEPEIILLSNSNEEEGSEVEVVVETRPKSPEVTLTASAKRRLNKLKRAQELELRKVEAENEKILSALDGPKYHNIVEVPVENFDEVFVLTISYFSKISRLRCYENEKFSTIFPKVADLFKLKVTEFLLCHKDTNITVDDTPKSLKLTPCDILECIPCKFSTDDAKKDDIEDDTNHLKIKFQSSDSKERTDLVIHKLEKLQEVMERYAKLRDIPLSLLAFEFDGERLTGTETPLDLDMESGNCIDVMVCKSSGECASKKSFEASVFTVDSDSDDCYMV